MSIDLQIAIAVFPLLVLFAGLVVRHIDAVRRFERGSL